MGVGVCLCDMAYVGVLEHVCKKLFLYVNAIANRAAASICLLHMTNTAVHNIAYKVNCLLLITLRVCST